MRVLHYYAQAFTHRSGVTAAINLWAAHQVARGWEASVVGAGEIPPAELYSVPASTWPHAGDSRRSLRPRWRGLRRRLREADVVVLHEGWTLSHYLVALACRSARVPYVVMPHGVYDPHIVASLKGPAALRHRPESWLLRGAAGIHLFFESEIPQVGVVSPHARCFVAPTGFEPCALEVVEPDDAYVLWFGRFDVHHKGLDLLLHGLAGLPEPDRPRLRIAGYDYDGGGADLRRLLADLRLEGAVAVEDRLDGPQKESALAATTAFVLPSRWECHSVALLEALGSGTRVLVSRGAHISRHLESVAGVDLVDATAEGWSQALAPLAALGPARFDRDDLWAQLSWVASLDRLESELEGVLRRSRR